MFLLNMSFISRVKWTIFLFHEWRSHELKIIISHFLIKIKDIFNKKHVNFLFIIYNCPIIFQGKEKRILLYISFCFDFLVVADEFIKALSFIKLLSNFDFLFTFP